MFSNNELECFRSKFDLLKRICILSLTILLTLLSSLTGCMVVRSDIGKNTPIELREITNYKGDEFLLKSLQFTRDNNNLLIGYYLGARLFDVIESKVTDNFVDNDSVKQVVLSDNEQYLLITSVASSTLWEFDTRKRLKQWDISVGIFGAISSDEKWILAGKNLIDTESLNTVKKLDVISSYSRAEFSKDSRYLVIGSLSRTQLYDLNNLNVKSEWRIGSLHTQGFFTPDSKYLLLLHGDRPGIFGPDPERDTLSIYETGSENRLFSISAGADITAYTFERKNQHLFVATKKGKIMRWDVNAQKLISKWVWDGWVTAMDADDNGNVWISYSNGDILVYWAASQQLSQVMTLPNSVFALAVSRDGKLLSVIESIKAKSEVTVYEIKSNE